MKKHKISILFKVFILGIVTSFIIASVSLIISYSNQVQRAEKTLDQSVDNALLSLVSEYSDQTQVSDLELSISKIVEYYNDRTSSYELKDYPDFASYEKDFQKACVWIYPVEGSMIGSRDYFDFSNAYRDVVDSLVHAKYASGATAAYIAVFDSEAQRFIFIADSRYVAKSVDGEFYYLPSSHYDLTEDDKISFDDSDYAFYLMNGRTTKCFFNTFEFEEIDNLDVYFFVEYSTKEAINTSLKILRTEVLILSLSLLISVVLYVLIAYLLFVKNINRLSNASNKISAQLSSNEDFEVVDINIESHDEIKNLADSLLLMENKIVDYIEIMKKNVKEKERENAELEIAKKIQLDALPKTVFNDENVTLRTYIMAAREVGGDFYDYFYLDDKLVVIISDVSGKGVPASLFMMKSKELIKSSLLNNSSLVDAVKNVNNILTINNDENLFVTSFIGVIDFKNNKINYVNAGHERPYIISQGQIIKLDGTSNFVLGGMEDIDYIEDSAEFNTGDILFMFTDGLNESINHSNEEFGYDNIVKVLEENKDSNVDEIIIKMNQALKDFVEDEEAFDDITMLVVRYDDSYKLHFEKKDYSIIESCVDSFNEHFNDIDPEVKAKVGIVLDELLNNLISYEKREDLVIDLDFKVQNQELMIIVKSNGDDYNILKNLHEKKIQSDDEELGGFGISLVYNLSKEVTYDYLDGHSVITIKFDI